MTKREEYIEKMVNEVNRSKSDLYSEICRVLTWYEHTEEYPFNEGDDCEKVISDELYKVLVRVQNELF